MGLSKRNYLFGAILFAYAIAVLLAMTGTACSDRSQAVGQSTENTMPNNEDIQLRVPAELPPIDAAAPKQYETATFSLG